MIIKIQINECYEFRHIEKVKTQILNDIDFTMMRNSKRIPVRVLLWDFSVHSNHVDKKREICTYRKLQIMKHIWTLRIIIYN